MNKKIAIIGSGNMGQAIALGLLEKKNLNQNQLTLTNSKTNNNKDAVKNSDVIILAVKPQILSGILLEIKDAVRKDQLIISIAAGVTTQSIEKILHSVQNDKLSIIRVMPNLAAQVGESISVWFANKYVTKEQKKIVVEILSAIGIQVELKQEEEIDKATAISGSGPAYFYYLVEQLENAAIEFGFSPEIAKKLVKQTFIGAAKTLEKSERSAAELRAAVTSKKGTTEAALTVFQKEKLHSRIKKGIYASFTRAKQLGE